MGAWGEGPFDNDDAADFAGDVSDLSSEAVIAAKLGDALLAVTAADGYIEMPDMANAVAAACIVAILRDAALPAPLALSPAWLEANRFPPSELLCAHSASVLSRAFEPADNEWHELWVESGLLDEVRINLAPYSAALS